MEEWRSVKDFPNYEVSNTGKVRNSQNKREILGHILVNGYRQVALSYASRPYYKMVHCLVAREFIGEKPIGYDVNHKDGNKTNNSIENLEYVSHSENMIHAVNVLGNPGKKLDKTKAAEIRVMLRDGAKQSSVAAIYDVCDCTIRMIAKQVMWKDDSGEITSKRRKLNPSKVLAIRERARNGEVHAKIAEDYGVSASTIDYVVNGKLWKSVGFPQKG